MLLFIYYHKKYEKDIDYGEKDKEKLWYRIKTYDYTKKSIVVRMRERGKLGMNGLTVLSEFIVRLKLEDVPDKVKAAAADCILDTIPVAAGAWKRRLLRDAAEVLTLETRGCGQTVSVWGTGETAVLSQAVLLNGMAAHSLELDDVHTSSKTHIGAVVIPAAWGMAEYLRKGVEELLLAVICGYEVTARIGMAFGVSAHRNKGWHATSTAGTFGAAAACGKLMGLSVDQMVAALGLAGTQSFGVWAFLADGANCKILHPGRAAANGAEAALFAGAGMTGSRYILEAKDGGLFAAMSDAPEPHWVDWKLGESWEICHMDKKPYPCCRSTHCVIDAALALREVCVPNVDEIGEIEVFTYLIGNQQCGMSEGSRNPQNVVDAKFSTPFTAACALLYGKVTEEYFTENTIQDSHVQNLLHKVRVITDESFTEKYPRHWGCKMVIRMNDGRTFSREISDASGSPESPPTDKQKTDKALGALRPVYGKQAEAVLKQLKELMESARMWDGKEKKHADISAIWRWKPGS